LGLQSKLVDLALRKTQDARSEVIGSVAEIRQDLDRLNQIVGALGLTLTPMPGRVSMLAELESEATSASFGRLKDIARELASIREEVVTHADALIEKETTKVKEEIKQLERNKKIEGDELLRKAASSESASRISDNKRDANDILEIISEYYPTGIYIGVAVLIGGVIYSRAHADEVSFRTSFVGLATWIYGVGGVIAWPLTLYLLYAVWVAAVNGRLRKRQAVKDLEHQQRVAGFSRTHDSTVANIDTDILRLQSRVTELNSALANPGTSGSS
jgi:hypothetical protein